MRTPSSSSSRAASASLHHAEGERERHWDGHLALLYGNEPQRIAGLAQWVGAGLDAGEKVVCGEADAHARGRTLAQLEEHGIEAHTAMRAGLLDLVDAEDFLLGRAQERLVLAALDEGYPGVRVCVEARTALSSLSPEGLRAFERALDWICRTQPVSGLCQYPFGTAARLLEPEVDSLARYLGVDLEGSLGEELDVVDAVEAHLTGTRASLFGTAAAADDAVAIYGEVDLSNAEVLRAVIAATVRQAWASQIPGLDGGGTPSPEVRLDLSGLEFLDGASAAALLTETDHLRASGGHLVLRSPRAVVARVLDVLGVDAAPGVVVQLDPRES